MKFRPLSFLLVLLTASCSSSKKDEESKEQGDGATVSNIGRFMDKGYDRKTREWRSDMTSQFDQKTFSNHKEFKSGKFKTSEFAGTNEFHTGKQFKTKDFAQADKKSGWFNKMFGGSSKESSEAGKVFGTKTSSLGGQTSSFADKTFAGGDDQYSTRSYLEAEKSIQKSQKPLIITQDPGKGYSEDQIKGLLGRQ